MNKTTLSAYDVNGKFAGFYFKETPNWTYLTLRLDDAHDFGDAEAAAALANEGTNPVAWPADFEGPVEWKVQKHYDGRPDDIQKGIEAAREILEKNVEEGDIIVKSVDYGGKVGEYSYVDDESGEEFHEEGNYLIKVTAIIKSDVLRDMQLDDSINEWAWDIEDEFAEKNPGYEMELNFEEADSLKTTYRSLKLSK